MILVIALSGGLVFGTCNGGRGFNSRSLASEVAGRPEPSRPSHGVGRVAQEGFRTFRELEG